MKNDKGVLLKPFPKIVCNKIGSQYKKLAEISRGGYPIQRAGQVGTPRIVQLMLVLKVIQFKTL
jgi:hypothetical protein